MQEKKVRNNFRDMIGDYYKTNRKISSENVKSKRGTPLTSKEKSMIIMILLLLIVLILKSFYFDEVKSLPEDETKFKNFVEYSVSQEYDGFLEQSGLMIYRVYDIYMADKDERGVLRYRDADTGKMVEIIQNGRYNARVRGYFLWILPVKHFSVTAAVEE